MFRSEVLPQQLNLDYKSLDLFKMVKTKMDTYKNEDEFYYKPNDIKDWYYEWDFKEYNPNIFSHGFHQYPAKFIPQLARKLLRVFTDEQSIILDNFMGSGTALIESMLLNRKKAIGMELNPFACFMAKVKTTSIKPNILNSFYNKIKKEFISVKSYKLHYFPNINFWFKERQIEDLSKLKHLIMNVDDENVRDFFLLCMSEVVRRVSLTNHNGFKLHRDKEKLREDFNPNVIDYFDYFANRNMELMNQFYEKTKYSKTEIKIIQGDSRFIQEIQENSVDFILTSPPYGDSKTTVAYGQFSRLSWQWINNDLSIYNIDEKLLGGKINNQDKEILDYSKTLKLQYELIKNEDNKRSEEVLSFYFDLFQAIKCAYNYLKNGKYFVLVTGNRTVKNVFLRTDLIISEMSNNIGFKTEKILFRNITNKRMPIKNSPSNKKGQTSNTMLKENIIFLKKEVR
ncbi:MAG: site-specific DNA-methyltransferase [Exilispira sp.]|jgi:DNA modification methylase|nr:site-specific DNA-methyltransferase [Exilispira sp.]